MTTCNGFGVLLHTERGAGGGSPVGIKEGVLFRQFVAHRCDTPSQEGVSPLGGYFAKRVEDKPSQVHPRVRKGQLVGLHYHVVASDNVDIDGAVAI